MSASAETKTVEGEDLPEEQQNSPQNGELGEDYNVDSAAKGSSIPQEEKASSAGGKIFIGGLSWETTTEKLTSHFKKYGELTDSVIMKDRETGRSRGFGFVTYADPRVCDQVLKEPQNLDGRTVDCKRSIPRENMDAVKGPKTKKIFVGGISPSITEEEFKDHFSTFGKVVEHQIMLDSATGRSRGFGFIVFDDEQSVEDILAHGKMHDFGGKQVEIKKAEPKRSQETGSRLVPRGGYGSSARGRGYGGYNDGFGLGGGSSYDNTTFRSGAGYGGRGYGAYSGHYGGGYGSGYGETGIGLGGYGGSVGGVYGTGLMGNYLDDDYSSLSYGGYGGVGYGGSFGIGGGYGGGYGSTRNYGNIGGGRYHPYGRN